MANILVVGSVAWDEVVKMESPMRSGAHNQGRWIGKRIGGGAANTGMALARAGDRALIVSAVGDDPDGERLMQELMRMGLDTRYLERGADATTRSLVILEEGGERTIVNLSRARVPLPSALAAIPANCLYVRSADPALQPILDKRVQHGGLVVAHVPPLDAGCLPAQVLVASAADLDGKFLADPYGAGFGIAGAHLAWMVITDAAEGAKAYGPDRVLSAAAPPGKVVDTTGAGDVFAAGLCHALAHGKDMDAALTTAVEWGTISVRYEGTVPPPGFPYSLES